MKRNMFLFWKESRANPWLFSHSWEQRKLGEMGTTFTGLSGKTKEDFGHGDARFVTYMNVFTNPVSDPHRVEAVEIDKSQNSVQYGDVFFTTSSETPEEVGMSSVWLENADNTYLNSFCFGFRPTDIIDPYYMAYMLRSEAVRKKIIYLAQGISRYNISKNGVMRIEIPLPDIAEQRLVGEYFKSLDNLITLHQRDYILERKAVSASSEKKATAWEQRKLGECFSERTESDPNGELISVTIGSGIKKFSELGRHDNSNDDKSKYKKVVVGDIAYNSMRMWQGASGYSPYNGIVSPAYTVITPFSGIDSKFFAYMFKREDMIHTFQIRSQGITSDNWNLKFPTLSEIPVMVPSAVKEQEAIAEYLTKLDNLITLHQRECKIINLEVKNVKQDKRDRFILQLLRSVD